jgi:hypothetical protein
MALAHILRAAIEWPLVACLLLAFLQLVAEELTLSTLIGTGT